MKALRFLGVAILACSMIFVSCKKDKQFTITANSNNEAWGTVTGGGTYAENVQATLTATAKSGYTFVKWQDGNTTNPRTITVTKNETYTATFEQAPQSKITFGSQTWTNAELDFDVQSMPNNIFAWIFVNNPSDYPQFQGILGNHTGSFTLENDGIYLLFVENETETTPDWQPKNLNETVTAIDLTELTISATINGTLKSQSTSEEKALNITFNNAEWIEAQLQAKNHFVAKF